ncbi:MAG: hypothetical protein Q8Q01_00190 [archaeon]|nr:hypothetical protein [archaeon]
MVSINAYLLLQKAATISQQKWDAVSKQEIQKKINEIKYLSSQKKVPKLSLRKEVIHLENKLERVFEMEESFSSRKREESLKITSLKRQIAAMQKRLAACDEKDLQKKVDRLTHLLGDYLARQEVEKATQPIPLLPKKATPLLLSVKPQLKLPINNLSQKLSQLRESLAKQKELDPERAKLLEKRINEVEIKISGSNKSEIKHDVLWETTTNKVSKNIKK